MSAENDLVREIEGQAEALSTAVASAEQALRDVNAEADREKETALGDLRRDHNRRMAAIREEHGRNLEREVGNLLGVDRRSGRWTAPWSDKLFRGFEPAAGVPEAVRFGSLRFRGPFSEVKTPALLPFTGGRNLVIRASGSAKDSAAAAVEALVLRLLLTVPPAKLKLLLIDPVGLGRHVSSLMTLASYDDELVSGQAWVEPRDIEERLAAMSGHMETVIQRFLRKRYATMEEYNEMAGEVAEPYRIVVAINFPVNFTQSSARRLVSIARNGPRCGVLTLMTVDTEQQLPHGFVQDDLERDAVVIGEENGFFRWEDPDYRHGRLELDLPPEPDRIEELLQGLGEAAQSASKVEVPFKRVTPDPDTWWTFDSREGIKTAIGRHGATELQDLDLEDASPHGLMVGQTGSGKTTLMHVIITSLALRFSPEELALYLVDFKGGVGFKHYTPTEDGRVVLPHARVIAIQSEREFGLSCLLGLEKEMDRPRGPLP